ncbi:MAG: hypothetical protein WBP72_07305 [Rhodocyclaceae bacterium]
MSLLFRDRYCAALCPDRVVLVRRRRGFRTPVDLKAGVAVEPGDHEAPWLPGTAALKEILANTASGSGELVLVLSNHFVRYLIVPWEDSIGSPKEYQRYAHVAFESVYGDTARNWVVRLSPEKARAPRLASAIDPELDAALRRLGGGKLRLISVQPYLMAAFNRLGAAFRKGDFFFLLAEPGRACALAATAGRWQTLRNQAVPNTESIAELAERELRLLETGSGPLPRLYVHAPELPTIRLPIVNGMAPQRLDLPMTAGIDAERDLSFSMALAAR